MRNKVGKIVRSLLIYKVVEPVGEKETGMCSPFHNRGFVGPVTGEVVLRKLYRLALAYIAEIFICKGFTVIFAVAHTKK